jgi:hypothetical protein
MEIVTDDEAPDEPLPGKRLPLHKVILLRRTGMLSMTFSV